jgi:hypothetical protein
MMIPVQQLHLLLLLPVPIQPIQIQELLLRRCASPGCANYAGGDIWFSVVVPVVAHLA